MSQFVERLLRRETCLDERANRAEVVSKLELDVLTCQCSICDSVLYPPFLNTCYYYVYCSLSCLYIHEVLCFKRSLVFRSLFLSLFLSLSLILHLALSLCVSLSVSASLSVSQ